MVDATPLPSEDEHFDVIQRLNRDLKNASKLLKRREARYLVRLYYQIQKARIRAGNQLVKLKEFGQPYEMVEHFHGMFWIQECQLRLALKHFANEYRIGQWLQSLVGVGPVISAGLLAELDVRGKTTYGHFHRFAGLDPTMEWKEGEERPWNQDLKILVVFKAGDSFIKQQNREGCLYGKLYAERRAKDDAINAAGGFKETAESLLSKFTRDTVSRASYKKGELPKGHLLSRARRYAAKIFLSHVHHAMYEDYYSFPPPKPYPIAHLGHADYIPVPNWPYMDGDGKPLSVLLDSEPPRKDQSRE